MDKKNLFNHLFTRLVWLYLIGLSAWGLIHLLFNDQLGFMGFLNPFAFYFFLPSFIFLPISWMYRNRNLFVLSGIAVLITIYLWGGLFLPKQHFNGNRDHSFSVMTYNAKGTNLNTSNTIEMILLAEVDIILIQELNLELGEELQKLNDLYPYQIVDAKRGVLGMGIVSKIPLQLSELSLPFSWLGDPMLAEIKIGGQKILLVNVHLFPPSATYLSSISQIINARNKQAQALQDLLKQVSMPVIIGGDFNSSNLSTTYKIVTANAEDTWLKVGEGLGNTFPGKDYPNGDRPKLGYFDLPEWMIRIDYLFYTNGLLPISAHNAPSMDLSDHRGVIGEYLVIP